MAFEKGDGELHFFGCKGIRSGAVSPEIVGNKGANLIHMADAGLVVPPGFILPTTFCRAFYQNGQKLPGDIQGSLRQGLREIEKSTGLNFGGERRPLLVAIRSGSPTSMPGMLDTLLNVGLCDRTLPALVRMTGNPRHAWDLYRRLIQAYAEIVQGVPASEFDRTVEDHLQQESIPTIAELDVAALISLVHDFLDHYSTKAGHPFPQDPVAQLSLAVEAVFRSWQGDKAVKYRRLHDLDDTAGTAVTIQAMVFGNMGSTSGSGVGFTRNPATGENELYLDFLPNAQGEDVVSGRSLSQGVPDLRVSQPELYAQLQKVKQQLELLFHDAQDFEFTVQEGHLYLLQTRTAKRTPWAAVRITCEQVAEGLIDQATALQRLAPYDLESIQRLRIVTAEHCRPIGSGVSAGPGVAIGRAVFDAEAAVKLAEKGGRPILIRNDMSTADIAGLAAAVGILTARGGRTSHAAVVARQLNKVCIVGCRDLLVAESGQRCRISDQIIDEGAAVSLDGNSGRVYAGKLEVVVDKPTRYLQQVESWKASDSIDLKPVLTTQSH